MPSNTWFKKTSLSVAVVALLSPLVTQCGGGLGGLPGADMVPGAAKCPDLTNVDALADFDWAGNFKIEADAAAKIKSGVIASVEIESFAKAMDADLLTACGGIAKDLGAAGEFKTGEEACKAAAKAIGDVKGKLGASAKLAVDFDPPKCGASMDVFANCAGKCDGSVQGPEAKGTCEPGKLQGECSGQCEGTCDMSAAGKCDGTCNGKCDATIKGKCGGICDGKCDGKASKGQCAGTCEGKCDADMQGSCSGQCSGSCQLKAKAECKGTCTGSCSGEMKAPKCTGEYTPPKVNAECKAQCDARANAKVECTPARVMVRVVGGADAALATNLQKTLEKNLPLVLKVAVGMGERAVKLVGNVQSVVEGVQGSVTAMTSNPPQDPVKAAALASLGACVAGPFKGVADAAGSIKGSVSASVEVKGSISGSAGGKT
jgi:hypothetical protein